MENIIMIIWTIICVFIITTIKTHKSLNEITYGIKRRNDAIVGGLIAALIVGLIFYVISLYHPIKPISPTITIPTIMCTVLLLSECVIPPAARYLTRRLVHHKMV